ncbi:MAG: carboxymuconolactone decarboxylase family protein [Candidatus Latescibacteria bacterium]|nr:carboxymuconolactone decarboxylase family protein [Candidatus Latescibacterota bacterium]NIM22677.1 carboxymuconolactone decarboxylase family protein [Candidatus Latescibacterota bacterium]NIM64966.1 carboxymuconolactone decarboxylase family protein [Candidatus Latescibacterota bacterium]NIO01481.1 carboxymuconolactone decarboxylase family protein [Candidatus Latescibacterota bacterium]NIO27991.1 carboxymuconolactone decarboxylase family protein [Candidatus Latescibacterota bacterium]
MKGSHHSIWRLSRARSGFRKTSKRRSVVTGKVDDFNKFRDEMNRKILENENLVIRRFFNLDGMTYKEGVLTGKTKEMLGLVASMVLRCDDCIRYHLQQCKHEGVTRDEFFEVFSVALVVGGSIVIPHLRRAVDFLEELEAA